MTERRPGGRQMPRAGRHRNGFGFLLVVAACSAPDASELYKPFRSGMGGEQADASASGAGGTLADASAQAGGDGGEGGSAGLGGTAGSSFTDTGGSSSDPDGGVVDAGSLPDAEPPPCVPTSVDEVCDGIDNDCDGEVDPEGTCNDGCAGFALEARGYMYCAGPASRSNAEDDCGQAGMHLVWLETPEESEAVRALIVLTGLPAPAGNAELLTQIGGSDAASEGEWSWVGNGDITGGFQFWQGNSGGQAVGGAYVEWSAGEPSAMANEDCAAMSVLGGAMRQAGEWDDRSCTQQLPYLCEAP